MPDFPHGSLEQFTRAMMDRGILPPELPYGQNPTTSKSNPLWMPNRPALNPAPPWSMGPGSSAQNPNLPALYRAPQAAPNVSSGVISTPMVAALAAMLSLGGSSDPNVLRMRGLLPPEKDTTQQSYEPFGTTPSGSMANYPGVNQLVMEMLKGQEAQPNTAPDMPNGMMRMIRQRQQIYPGMRPAEPMGVAGAQEPVWQDYQGGQ